jgi:hypothetical protein
MAAHRCRRLRICTQGGDGQILLYCCVKPPRRSNTTLNAQASPRDQVYDHQYQDDHQEYVNEPSADVKQEPNQPKEEQYDDDRPQYTYHLTSNECSVDHIAAQSTPISG